MSLLQEKFHNALNVAITVLLFDLNGYQVNFEQINGCF